MHCLVWNGDLHVGLESAARHGLNPTPAPYRVPPDHQSFSACVGTLTECGLFLEFKAEFDRLEKPRTALPKKNVIPLARNEGVV